MGSRYGGDDDRVRLRPLTAKEQRVLTRKLRTLSLPARVHRRYQIVAAARGAPSIPAVARRLGCPVTVAYDWVHHFNAHGVRDFERVANPRGRIPSWRPEQLRELVDIALSSPRERGLPFSVWSVPKLAEYCRGRGLFPPFTDEWFRRLLRRQGLSAQRIRTWKTSNDPQFDTKKNGCGRSTAGARRGRR
jgi:transposase